MSTGKTSDAEARGRDAGDESHSSDAHVPRWVAWASTLCVSAIALAMAFASVPMHVQAGDAGELATVMLRGGVPHPSGYPWMRIIGPVAGAFEYLSIAPARAAALPCALAGVGAWLVMHRMFVRWGLPTIGAFSVLVIALAAPVVLHVNDSEVWGLHLLLSALVLRLGLAPGSCSPVQLGVLLGLAVSHHLSGLLLVPFVVGAAWPSRTSARGLVSAGLLGLFGSAIGLLPYLTLAIGSGDAWRWGDPSTVSGLIHHITRADYGVLQLSLHQGQPDRWQLVARALSTVGESLCAGIGKGPIAGGVLIAAVTVLGVLGRPSTVRRTAWWGVLGSALASTLAFPAVHNIDPANVFGAWILERFDLLSLLLWCPLLAAGIGWVGARLRGRVLPILAAVLGLVLLGRQALRSIAYGLPSQEPGVEHYALDLLDTPPAGELALVFGTDDHRLFPVVFVQEVLGHRTDAVYIDASLLSQPWYRRHIRRQWPALPEADKPLELIGKIWDDPARRDVPIYLANIFSRPAQRLAKVPEGVLWRIVPPHADPRAFDVQAVLSRHREALGRYRGVRPSRAPGHPWSRDLAAIYGAHTAQLIDALEAEGRGGEADALRSAFAALVQRAENEL